ncbi:MAG: sugar phosphate isomerase/epimerase [Clostridiales bacterium]|nr:sugar phosphate isomerase/epimerase [Clostridiales bacterium]
MISIYDWFGYELPIRERYKLIKHVGFDGVLLWWSNGFGRGDYRSGAKFAREEGLIIENIHAPVQNQNDLWLDNLNGEELFSCYLQCVGDCAELEIPTMVVHLPEENYIHNELGLYRIKRIAEKAEQLGINVAMENVRNLTNLTFVLDQIDSKCMGFCYDCCHHQNYNSDVDLLSIYGDRLMALHLHDNGGNRHQHQLPFDGKINWDATMKSIAQTGYVGSTALEPMNWDYTDWTAEKFLNKAFEKAKKLEILRKIAY